MKLTSSLSATGWCVLTGLYFMMISLGHLQFSLWLVRERSAPWGPFAFKDLVPLVVVVGAFGLLVLISRGLRLSPHPRRLLLAWATWLICVVLYDHWLIFVINEYAHYPQYALLGFMLARSAESMSGRVNYSRLLWWGTVLGALDEASQYLWVTRSYSDYFDFNDVLLNLLGVVAGLMIYQATYRPVPDTGWRRAEWISLGSLILGLLAAIVAGYLAISPPHEVPPGGIDHARDGRVRIYLQRQATFYGNWQAAPHHSHYRVLTPAEGLGLTVLGAGIFAAFLGWISPAAKNCGLWDDAAGPAGRPQTSPAFAQDDGLSSPGASARCPWSGS